MDYINQPMVETLPVIWNKLCQFFIWLFTADSNEKCNFYKVMILSILVFFVMDIWILYLYRDNDKSVFFNAFCALAANLIDILMLVFLIEITFR